MGEVRMKADRATGYMKKDQTAVVPKRQRGPERICIGCRDPYTNVQSDDVVVFPGTPSRVLQGFQPILTGPKPAKLRGVPV